MLHFQDKPISHDDTQKDTLSTTIVAKSTNLPACNTEEKEEEEEEEDENDSNHPDDNNTQKLSIKTHQPAVNKEEEEGEEEEKEKHDIKLIKGGDAVLTWLAQASSDEPWNPANPTHTVGTGTLNARRRMKDKIDRILNGRR